MASSKGNEIGKLADFITKVAEQVNAVQGSINVSVDQKTFNTYTKNTKVELGKAYIKISGQIERLSKEASQFNLNSNIWQWPRTTVRKNGSVVSSPRNIVDSGFLASKDSWSAKFTQKGITISYKNTAPYAGLMHYGGYIRTRDGRRSSYFPPRPWASVIWSEVSGQYTNYASAGARVVPVKQIIETELAAALRKASAS